MIKLTKVEMKNVLGGANWLYSAGCCSTDGVNCSWSGECQDPGLQQCMTEGLRCDYDSNNNLLPSIPYCMQYCQQL